MQANVNEADTKAKLFKAIEAGDLVGVRELIAIDPRLATSKNKDGASALTWAAYYRKEDIVDFLLQNGVTPDLFEASTVGQDQRVQELLRADRAAVGRYSFDGWTALHLAAHFGRVDAMRTLIASGADHRAVSRNTNRNQPLQAAAANNQPAAVDLLLRAGADVDARSHGDFTALHIAAANGNVRIVEALLAAGADPTAKTDGGKTPIDFAIEGDHRDAVALLERASRAGKGATST